MHARRGVNCNIHLPQVSFEGWLDVALVHAVSGNVAESFSFRNLVLDQGLNHLGSSSSTARLLDITSHIAVGKGTSAPAAAQTSLDIELARTNSGSTVAVGTGPGNAYRYKRFERVFTTAQANDTLTEIAVCGPTVGGVLGTGTHWARQLIRDANGNATSITKTSDYELRVTYELRVYIPTATVRGSMLVNGVAQDYDIRASWLPLDAWLQSYANIGTEHLTAMAYSTDVLQAVADQTLAGTGTSNASGYAEATSGQMLDGGYVSGSFKRVQRNVWNAGAANFAGGVGSFGLFHSSYSGNALTPMFHVVLVGGKASKSNTQTLTLDWEKSWGRHSG